MELNDLRAFIKVAESGNISQAAVSLGLTQPTVSRIIGGLEREFGSPLFYRTGRGVLLTEVGQAAIPKARSIVINSEQLIVDMQDFGQVPSGVVAVAMLPSLMRSIAGDLFEEVRQTYPSVTLQMMEGFSGRNEEWLADGRADIALISRYRKPAARSAEVLAASHVALVGPRDETAKPGIVKFRELAKLPLVLPSIPNELRAAVDAVARRMKLQLNVVAEVESFEAQKVIVTRQRCYTLLGPQAVEMEIASGLFEARKIVDPKITRFLVMLMTTHRPPSRAAREVASIVRRLTR